MRVALLTREYPPEVYGGAGVHVDYLSRELARSVDVAVHCFGAPRESALVARAYRPWGALSGPAASSAALETMSVDLEMASALGDADVVHSHTWYANLGGHLGKLLWSVPHVMTTHSLEPLRPWKAEQLGGGYALSSFCERTAIESADAVIAVSEGMRDDILACYPAVDGARVTVIHNGIDSGEYRPDRGGDAVARVGLDPSRPSVMYLGRITRQKGIVHLLDAASLLGGDAQLVLVAGSPDTPQIAAEVAAKVAAARDAGRSVIWVQEMLPRHDVIQLLTHADVLVCPSVYEPFGLVNLEAMACETPVVATAVGGIPEVVVDGETGLLVPAAIAERAGAGDVHAFAELAGELAQRIDAVLADPAAARRMGEAGRRRVVERF
ncbi:MAG TPA: glycogen synthase, partial [Candidatus Dormibacteraeota bacterium]|nr:glycogen synthase [Candidatus Dormibacteraeota bacterium]